MATTVSGQSLHDDLIVRLGGYQNAFDSSSLLSFINEGHAEVWAILKTLDDEYFVEDTQTADSSADDYMAALTTSAREFNLPANVREVRLIEVTAPSGFEHVRFEYRKQSDPEFREARALATAQGAGSGTPTAIYYYTILGKRTLQLASYPEAAFTLKIWYVRSLDDIDFDDVVDEILHPYTKKIVTFALERALKTLQDETLSREWLEAWRDDIRTLVMAATPRDSSGPRFIAEYFGE